MEELVVTPQDDTAGNLVVNAQDDAAKEFIDIGTAEPQAADEQGAEHTQDGAAKPKIENKTDFHYVLNRRLEDERKKYAKRYESSDEYQIGKMLLQDRAAKDGISVQEARRRIESERIEAQAKQYAENPQSFYQDYIRAKQPEQTPIQDPAMNLSQQIIEARESGVLPEEFSPEHVNSDFVENVQRYGIEAASKIWQAQQPSKVEADRIADEIEKRRNMPKPMNPVSGNVTPPRTNFSEMSSEEFWKLEKQVQEARLRGKTPRF